MQATLFPPVEEPMGRYLEMADRDYRRAPGLSTSALRLMRKSPAHFKSNLDHPQPPTEQMNFGTALHEYMLGGHTEDSRLIVRPDLQSPYTKEGKEWKAQNVKLGKVIVSEEEMENIAAMRQCLLSNAEIASVLSCRKEVSMFMADEFGQFKFTLKGRADLCPIDTDALWDIKTTPDASNLNKLKWKIIDYGYDLQAHIYLKLFNATREKGEPPKTRFIFIFVETQRPFGFRKIELEPDWMSRAEQDYHWLIGLYAQCKLSDKWPGYEDRVTALRYPSYRASESENYEE